MQILTIEGGTQSTHLVQKYANTPNIGLVVISVALDYFRAQVVWGSNYSFCHLRRRLQDSSNSEVSQLDYTILHEENILCFDVAM